MNLLEGRCRFVGTILIVANPSNTLANTSTLAHDYPRARAMFERAKDAYENALKRNGPPETLEPSCQLFEESLRLDRALETLFYLAHCRKDQGKSATAFALYKETAELADDQNDLKIASDARDLADFVAKFRSFLTIKVDRRPAGLSITLDGSEVSLLELDAPIPVDEGTHNVTLRLKGFVPRKTPVPTVKAGENRTVEPLLPDLKLPVPPPQAAQNRVKVTSNPWPWVLGTAGATALVVGGVSGILAVHDNGTIGSRCHGMSPCSDFGALEIQRRRDFERSLAWATIPIGIAAVGAAATWMILERQPAQKLKPDSMARGVSLRVEAHGGSLLWEGQF